MIVYRRPTSGPGCGGCLLLLILLLLLLGGAPLLLNIVGALLLGLGIVVLGAIGALWAFTWYVRRKVRLYEQSQTESHNLFVYLLVHILVRIAQLDGEVSRAETAAISDFFRVHLHYNHQQMLWVKGLVKEAMASQLTLDDLLNEFRRRFGYEPRLILLELIYRVMYVKEVSPRELQTLQQIADFLAINPYDHQAIRARYQAGAGRAAGTRPAADQEARYYHTLGLEPGADFEQVKSAYRNLSKQYHPDKVNHLGEEFRKVAEEKMKEINQAYQYLKTRQEQG
ncbi:J domain-containing protein [Desulfurivibrio alkaliphilus]|uniref:Heat shock protein DnaJ domain protein n=1 Tax=Desulfurivibrio alkaliphilus (strain DSM 19089 / UNIQEM U267 / AHT2) TaxID=589865 RepID=D6Z2I5_DESAT|nr:J domain-containing protein [Desulfurivibrio alkaliphilus]ADH85760.1 heat shock protein DnaJ domain protein [Desulfurivibrio alkaliphilus AHT 2]